MFKLNSNKAPKIFIQQSYENLLMVVEVAFKTIKKN